jgi:DNA polymerase-3 subunit epsilon
MNRYVVVDTETTGLDPYCGNHRVIEIALVEVVDNVITGKQYQTYLNPQGRKSTKGAFRVHQIKDDFLKNKPLFSEVFDDIFSFIGDATLVIYNKDFDLKFLDHESVLANQSLKFSEAFQSRCLSKEATLQFRDQIR